MSHYAHPEALVETQWLVDRLEDPSIRIVEVDMSPEPYENAHIPGAVFWSIFSDLLLPDLSMNLDSGAIAALLSRSGISPETTVVAYGRYPDTGAWIFWLLKLYGHENVQVLNGGYQKWMAEDRPLASQLSSFSPTQYPENTLNPDLRASLTEVQAAFRRSDSVMLDVRTDKEYSGEIFMMKPPKGTERGGHIPGAVHVEHTLALEEDGTFKSAEELLALYRSQGISPEKAVIPYCAIGARSASTCFVLKYLLGYANVKNYDGSWNQWSRLPNTL